jgi:hypothetical protein
MTALSAFGLFAVTTTLMCYAGEDRDPLFILAFPVACALGATYGFLQGAWPFGLVEAVWALLAIGSFGAAIKTSRPAAADTPAA